jgi:hypothetical protein
MSTSSFHWPASVGNLDSICPIQNTVGASDLVLNSNEYSSEYNIAGFYVFDQMWRTVSLTSGITDNSAISATILGYGTATSGTTQTKAPSIISEVVTCPAASSTVNTTNIYKKIIRITVSGAVTDLSAGFGPSGMTEFSLMDPYRAPWEASFQCQIFNRTVATYTLYQTLTNPVYTSSEYADEPIPSFALGTPAATANQLVPITSPVTAVYAYITSNSGTNEHLEFTVLQQGTYQG